MNPEPRESYSRSYQAGVHAAQWAILHGVADPIGGSDRFANGWNDAVASHRNANRFASRAIDALLFGATVLSVGGVLLCALIVIANS